MRKKLESSTGQAWPTASMTEGTAVGLLLAAVGGNPRTNLEQKRNSGKENSKREP